MDWDNSVSDNATKRLTEKKSFLTGYDQNAEDIWEERKRANFRSVGAMPTATAASVGGDTGWGAGAVNQASLADRMKLIASGESSTAGQQQAQAGAETARRAMMASAFGRPGGAAGVRAMRTVGNQSAYGSAQAAQQGAIIGAQEQQAALAQYGALGTAMRTGDMTDAAERNKINMANAGFAQSAAMANQDAALRWQAMNDAQKRALLGQSIDLGQADWDAKLGYTQALKAKERGDYAAAKAKEDYENTQKAQALMMVATMGTSAYTGGASTLKPQGG